MNTSGESDTTTASAEPQQASAATNRRQRYGQGFLDTISTGWADRPATVPVPREQASYAAARRAAVSAAFPGQRLVIPAGSLKQRSNDTDYPFRAHSAFSHLTGWGADSEPDSVLVFDPTDDGHDVTLYFRERADRTTAEFYSDASVGEFWIGPRPALEGVAVDLGIATDHLDAFAPGEADLVIDADEDLTRFVSELRLVKDEHEVEQMREAVAATIAGFEEVVRHLPRAVEHRRGERVIETTFDAHARLEGNTVGYETIAAAGEHATTLHWIRNDGVVRAGELVLLDAGVEVDSLYTADVTRTLPVDGEFTDVQRRVYQAVLDAADAAFAVAVPGARFRDVHAAAMEVVAARLEEWGLLPVSAEESLSPEGQQHRRWMVHGTSHHLGLDVHDCAQARRELYLDGVLEPGMVFTIEPGLYFKADDLAVPEEYRGIGVRIEDDVLVTADGNENLSAALPRRPEDVEAWMARLRG